MGCCIAFILLALNTFHVALISFVKLLSEFPAIGCVKVKILSVVIAVLFALHEITEERPLLLLLSLLLEVHGFGYK